MTTSKQIAVSDDIKAILWSPGYNNRAYYSIYSVFHIKDAIQNCRTCGSESNQYIYKLDEPHAGKFSVGGGKETLDVVCSPALVHTAMHNELVAKIENHSDIRHPRDYLRSLSGDIGELKDWLLKK